MMQELGISDINEPLMKHIARIFQYDINSDEFKAILELFLKK